MSDGQSETQRELLTPRERLERAGWEWATNIKTTHVEAEAWKWIAPSKVVQAIERTEAAALAALAERCGV